MSVADQTLGPREPHLSRFKALIRQGAGTLDIHDKQDSESSFTRPALAYEALVQREVDRVAVHLNSICPLLAAHARPADRVLDVGCGTGATTVAVGLHRDLGAKTVLGVDPNEFSLEAARARWEAHSAPGCEVGFQYIKPDAPLPFSNDSFDLTLCVSVIEYLGDAASRAALAKELLRVTRPGGRVCLVTPNPVRLFDYHTHRLFGDWRRTSGYPWASPPWALARMFEGHEVHFLLGEQLEHGLRKRKLPMAKLLGRFSPLGWLLPWQKVIVTKH